MKDLENEKLIKMEKNTAGPHIILLIASILAAYATTCGFALPEIYEFNAGKDACDLMGGAPWILILWRGLLFYFFGYAANYILTHGKQWFK